jgi:predicted TIM-barrel fold metal-dependent hydrolase
MRYFDCHVHLASSDDDGFTKFVQYVRGRADLVACNLVLNTADELAVVARRRGELPSNVVVIPPVPLDLEVPAALSTSGWWKVHPTLHAITRDRIPAVVEKLRAVGAKGVMVHHFPWGDRLEHNTGLELVIELARALPDVPVVATHGGGYESWHLRAHTARLGNVYYDFSITFATFAGTDFLRPWVQYVQKRRNRILFGSDWPSAEAEPQLESAIRLAAEGGLAADALGAQLLENSKRLWSSVKGGELLR